MDEQFIEVNGEVIAFPANMTDEQIAAILSQQQPTVDPMAMVKSAAAENAPEPKSGFETAMDWTQSNLDVPAGVAGSIAGAAYGTSLAGIVGGIVGGIAGGAAGTFGGSLASDVLDGEDLDFANATKEAAISAGFDIATLGLGKIAKPIWNSLRKSGISPADAVQEIARRAGAAPKAGTAGSIAQSQALLNANNASLTAYQTGKASGAESFKESIANVGMMSRQTMAENANKVQEVARTELNKLLGGVDTKALPVDELGQRVFTVIDESKKAISRSYVQAMDEVKQLAPKARVPTKQIGKTVDDYISSKQFDFGSALDDSTLKTVEEIRETLKQTPSMSIESLIEYQKKVNSIVDEVSDIASNKYSSAAATQLSILNDKLKSSIYDAINVVKPEAAVKYKAANSAYASGLNGILPEINSTFIGQARKDSYDQIGKLLINVNDASKANALMKSIDTAFTRMDSKALANAGFKSAADAKEAIRHSYLSNLFKGADGQTLDIKAFKNIATQFETKTAAKKLASVMGKDYPATKRLMNLMHDASVNPSSNVGSILIRSREYGSLMSGATIATAGGLAGVGGAAGTAAIIFGIPTLWAKAATNPTAVNKLIALNKRSFANEAVAATALLNAAMDIARDDKELMLQIEEATGLDKQTIELIAKRGN